MPEKALAAVLKVIRRHPGADAYTIADTTGLYLSVVKSALAELARRGVIEHRTDRTEGKKV